MVSVISCKTEKQQDIAASSKELTKNASEKLHVGYVASDEVTANETANMLGKAMGKPNLKWVSFTDEEVKKSLKDRGLPEHFAQNLVDINASISSGRMGEDYEKNKTEMGKIKMEDFAEEFAAAFNEST